MALASRVLEGKDLPDINPMANLYNAMSIEYLTPYGGEDLDTLNGDFELDLAKGGERWIPIGGGKVKPAVKGELVWGDDYDLSTRALNWRQCDRTKLTSESKNGYFVMDGFGKVNKELIEKAAKKFVEKVVELFGGEAKIYWLDKANPEIEIDFESKKWDQGRVFVEAKKEAVNKKVEIKKINQVELTGIAKEIKEMVDQCLKSVDLPSVNFSVTHPKEESHGDYSVNVAMILAKKLGKNPRELAEKIVSKWSMVDSRWSKIIDKIEVAGAGFINFYLKSAFLRDKVEQIVADKWDKPLQGKKYSVEYTDPNPFKEFHLGHLYSNLIGESIAKIYEANGATAWRGDFYGDVGMHIAKSVWGMRQKMQEGKISLIDLEKLSIKKRQNFMGQGYALGVNKFEEDEQIKEEIKDINYMVYVASQEVLVKEREWKPLVKYEQYIQGHKDDYPEIRTIYQAGLKWSLEYFETYYVRLGTKFDAYYPESWVGEVGLQVVEKGLKMGVLELGEEGAVVYHGEKDGLHTRVFRNKMGLPTYEAKDLGLVKAKYSEFPFDYSLNIFGKEIDEYYKVVKKALEQIEPELGKKQEHLAHGMVNLPTGKMSSRKGNVITVEWLLNEARDQALKLIKNDKMSAAKKLEVAEQVGQGAVKYALLKSNVGENVPFDFGQSVSFSGASGPYIQYTFARAGSILTKAGKNGLVEFTDVSFNEDESSVLRSLYQYPEVVVEAAKNFTPQVVTTYLFGLAQQFNGFYN
ncbi:MAG: Arginine-tRNA ligase, partial [Microgenomates group bacterium GW2011_GWA2_46_7]